MNFYDYEDALKMAGAEVECFKRFGSYQGDWWAFVRFNGRSGWVHGYYGSCSGCDEIEALDNCWDDHPAESCEKCQTYLKKIKAIGERDLDEILSQEEAEKKAGEDISWDLDAQKELNFVRSRKPSETV